MCGAFDPDPVFSSRLTCCNLVLILPQISTGAVETWPAKYSSTEIEGKRSKGFTFEVTDAHSTSSNVFDKYYSSTAQQFHNDSILWTKANIKLTGAIQVQRCSV